MKAEKLSKQFGIKKIQPTSYVFSKQKRLGRGAFGQVYLGFDQKKKTPIAVKTISFQKIVKSNNSLDAFFQKLVGEMTNMQICKSQYLVELISPHKSSKNMYLVCEYCNGGSFKQYLSNYGPLSEYQTIYFFKNILNGIKILHDKKVVHRDLKPANILMHDYQLKIGDLGFSKSLEVHEQILTSIVGTPLYMSPQILGKKNYTQKTDVWSLGIILFEMLSGEAPWKVNSVPQILQKAKNKPDFQKIYHCSEQLKQLLLRMLQYQQNQRISMEELLNNFLKNQQMQQQDDNSQNQVHKQIIREQEYFTFSMSINSQRKIRHILSQNKINPHPFIQYSQCQNAKQFIFQIIQCEKIQSEINVFFDYFRTIRNRVTYLLAILFNIYHIMTKSGIGVNPWPNNTLGTFTSYIGASCMIFRYCIEVLYSVLDALQGKQSRFVKAIKENKLQQKYSIFRTCSLFRNFKLLINLDIHRLYNFYPNYFNLVLLPRLNSLNPQNKNHQNLVNNLSAFLTDKLPHYTVTEGQMQEQISQLNCRQSQNLLFFWLKNYLNLTYNQIKDFMQKREEEDLFENNQEQQNYVTEALKLNKLIYQFHRCESTQIFENVGKKINIYRKIEYWVSKNNLTTWYKKLRQQGTYLPVQHINTFISKQFKQQKLAMYKISFL